MTEEQRLEDWELDYQMFCQVCGALRIDCDCPDEDEEDEG